MTQRSPKFRMTDAAGVFATFVIGTVFFFTVVGVFGLRLAIIGLALGILIAVAITKRGPRGSDVL